ncbi:hypothetical protein AAZX31_08G349300 [Glycine max]
MVTVNGQFTGPRIVAREGDRLLIKVINHVQNNISIHWHGIQQLQSGWADGPAYVTQCPIQIGQSYVYNYTIGGQRGTLFWHAHISWLRSTLCDPIIILPKHGVPYPFTKPYKEVSIIFGEWWNADPEAVITQALQIGGGPNVSDAYTINGLPGPLPWHNSCPRNQTCQGPTNSTKFAASVNNISFIQPTTALLQTHFFGQSNGVYTPDFPTKTLVPFNYTGTPPNNTMVSNGTKVVVLPFNTSVELVMQDTSILGAESHPLHLHVFNFLLLVKDLGTLIQIRTLQTSILLILLKGTQLVSHLGMGCCQIPSR